MTHLEEYKRLIDSGKVIACRYLKKEIDNLVAEMKDPRYIYDTTDADKRIAFLERCCLQSKDPYYLKPLVLFPFQKAFIEALYSFKYRKTKRRRFIESLFLIARKNGKSTLCAGLAMYDLFAGRGGQDVACISNSDKQAKLIWDEVAKMRQHLDPKKTITGQNLVELRNELKNIHVIRISAKMRNLDGYNLNTVFMDESHDVDEENHKSELADACWRAMSTKEEPLFVNVTTQGVNRDCYLDYKIAEAKRIIDGEIDNERFLPFIFEQDSESEVWTNEASWEKSNPSLRYGVKKIEKLRYDVDAARYDKATRVELLTKDFNIPQSTSQGWLVLEDFDYKTAAFDLEDFRGCRYLAAVDLSATTDLSNAKILLMKPGDRTKYVVSKYFIPESKLELSDDKDAGAAYLEWARDGWIDIHDGNEIQVDKIADWFYELYKDYGLVPFKIGYDQRFAKTFLDRCGYYGFETEMLAQGRALSNAMKLTEAELKSRTVNYSGNPVDKWCLANCAMTMDGTGQIQPVKQKQFTKRIDGAVTLIMLFEIFRRYRSDFKTIIGG